MPLTYRIDDRIVTITGDYAQPEEWQALLSAVVADPAFKHGSNFLRDLRTSANPVDARTVMAILSVIRQFWEPLGVRRAAMVMAGDDTPALIAHALAEDAGLQLRAFTHYEDAVEWLRADEGVRRARSTAK